MNVYSGIIGQKVSDVWAFDYERSFKISLENTDLIFKMHRSRSNILIAKDGVVSQIFKNQLKNDLSIKPAELARAIKIDQTYFNAVPVHFIHSGLSPEPGPQLPGTGGSDPV